MHARLGLTNQLLGYPVAPTNGTILYLAMDRPKQVARAARRIFTEEERDLLATRVKIWPGPPPADIARTPELLLRLADAADAETVFLDSIKDAAIGLSEDEVGAGYNRARQYLLRDGRQLCEQHHTVKRGQSGPPTTVNDIYGSAWLANGTGSILLLTGDPGDPIVRMRHIRCPAAEIGPYQLIHDQQAGTVTIYRAADLLELVRACGADGLTAREAAATMFSIDIPTDAQIEKARRKLAKLENDGLLVSNPGLPGRGVKPSVWFLADRTGAP
jgi:replicative DNA helicase